MTKEPKYTFNDADQPVEVTEETNAAQEKRAKEHEKEIELQEIAFVKNPPKGCEFKEEKNKV